MIKRSHYAVQKKMSEIKRMIQINCCILPEVSELVFYESVALAVHLAQVMSHY